MTVTVTVTVEVTVSVTVMKLMRGPFAKNIAIEQVLIFGKILVIPMGVAYLFMVKPVLVRENMKIVVIYNHIRTQLPIVK